MLHCSSCKQSRWVRVRFGTLAADLERLTGWTPYWCQACARRGWHRSQSTPPPFNALRRLFLLARARLSALRPALKTWRTRLPVALHNGRLLATAGGLVSAFALGLWLGALLFSGPTVGADRERLAAADGVAPTPIAAGFPDETPAISAPARETRLAATPPAGDSLPVVMAPAAGVSPAVTPAGEGLRAETPPVVDVRAAVTPPAGSVPPPVAPPVASARKAVEPPVGNPPAAVTPTGEDQRIRSPLTAPKPVTRSATARDQREPQRTAAATVKPVSRAPGAVAPKSAVRAGVAASTKPALPRFHGSLAIRSEPRGALVSVDGQVVGPTPLLLKGVRAGSRVVRIESQGYERWSSAARVVANKETAIVATLQRN